MPDADLPTIARLACLQNAVQHDGTCQPRGLMGRLMGAHPEFRSDPGAVMAALVAAGEAVNAMGLEAQRAALEQEAPDLLETKQKERRTGLKELPGETTDVVMRFAPNPNGPLSLGHSRGLAILAEYRRAYDATLILRLDDTDPQVKPPLWDEKHGWNGYEMIHEDFAWLVGTEPDRVVLASDRIEHYYEVARRLIDAGGAYVCTCDAEAWREMKNTSTPCAHREKAPEMHQEAFARMVEGGYASGEAVLRIKTDIEHKDPALRDWTAFRVVAASAHHPRATAGQIEDWRCWPLLDFESAVEDHLQGVTHVIRGKDLMDSTRKQKFLYEHMGWTYPHTLYWGRITLHGFGKFSTSMMRMHIEKGDFEGWDDPRLPTLRALRRRGFRPEAIRAFWVGLGLTEKDIAVSLENLEAENAKAVELDADRLFFVPDPHTLRLEGAEGRTAKPFVHPSHPERGHRTLTPGTHVHIPGDEAQHTRLRLKDLGNVTVHHGVATLDDGPLDRSMPIVQWAPQDAVPFTVLKPSEPDDDESAHWLRHIEGLAEPAVRGAVGRVVQFERFGYVRVESPERGVWLSG